MKPALRTKAVFAKATIKTSERSLLGLIWFPGLLPQNWMEKHWKRDCVLIASSFNKLHTYILLRYKRKYTIDLLKINRTKAFPQARDCSDWRHATRLCVTKIMAENHIAFIKAGFHLRRSRSRSPNQKCTIRSSENQTNGVGRRTPIQLVNTRLSESEAKAEE